MTVLRGKHVVLGLTGGIACYKSAQLCRLLTQAGATVQVMMSSSAQRFITPLTFQALSGRPVATTAWGDEAAAGPGHGMPHIALGRDADAVIIAPASADFMARLASGRCDDLLTLTCIARPPNRGPLLLAPAMNREMWAHPATQRNLNQLREDGVRVLPVGEGPQACGETGDGRMLEPEALVAELETALTPPQLTGLHVLITAGPTYEALDPVRGLTNLSSGKMGFALAKAAREAGARVTLVAGPVGLSTPYGVARHDVRSAREMLATVQQLREDADVFIASAAVADWRPVTEAEHKIKKDPAQNAPVLHLTENPDILADTARAERARQGRLYCVGFAAESQDLLALAQAKRVRKQVPLLVANIGPDTFGRDDNAVMLLDDQGHETFGRTDKLSLARALVVALAKRHQAWRAAQGPR